MKRSHSGKAGEVIGPSTPTTRQSLTRPNTAIERKYVLWPMGFLILAGICTSYLAFSIGRNDAPFPYKSCDLIMEQRAACYSGCKHAWSIGKVDAQSCFDLCREEYMIEFTPRGGIAQCGYDGEWKYQGGGVQHD